jgi:hypothetical protein
MGSIFEDVEERQQAGGEPDRERELCSAPTKTATPTVPTIVRRKKWGSGAACVQLIFRQ